MFHFCNMKMFSGSDGSGESSHSGGSGGNRGSKSSGSGGTYKFLKIQNTNILYLIEVINFVKFKACWGM